MYIFFIDRFFFSSAIRSLTLLLLLCYCFRLFSSPICIIYCTNHFESSTHPFTYLTNHIEFLSVPFSWYYSSGVEALLNLPGCSVSADSVSVLSLILQVSTPPHSTPSYKYPPSPLHLISTLPLHSIL